MSTELIAILLSFGLGILGLFSTSQRDSKSERLSPLGWLSFCLLMGSCAVAIYASQDKQRQLVAEREQVKDLQRSLATANQVAQSMRETTDHLTTERDSLRGQLQEFERILANYKAGVDLPHSIEVADTSGTWSGDTITLKLSLPMLRPLTIIRVTDIFDGSPFKKRRLTARVAVVNVRPEDMKRLTFCGVYLQGAFFYPRSDGFVHGDEIKIDTIDDDGDYGIFISRGDLDVMDEVLRRNPEAAIQLTILPDA